MTQSNSLELHLVWTSDILVMTCHFGCDVFGHDVSFWFPRSMTRHECIMTHHDQTCQFLKARKRIIWACLPVVWTVKYIAKALMVLCSSPYEYVAGNIWYWKVVTRHAYSWCVTCVLTMLGSVYHLHTPYLTWSRKWSAWCGLRTTRGPAG